MTQTSETKTKPIVKSFTIYVKDLLISLFGYKYQLPLYGEQTYSKNCNCFSRY